MTTTARVTNALRCTPTNSNLLIGLHSLTDEQKLWMALSRWCIALRSWRVCKR